MPPQENITNAHILEELRAVRAELIVLVRASEHFHTIAREQHRRISTNEEGLRKMLWGVSAGIMTILGTVVAASIVALL